MRCSSARRGFNHFHELYRSAQTQTGWAAFQYTTEEGGNVKLAELQSATHELDERIYAQEFQAKFENLTAGKAYFAFDRARNVRPLEYNPKLPIFWALDFNVNPVCSVIGQRVGNHVHILDELVLPDSNTWAACEEFLARTEPWLTYQPLQVYLYGDSTGASRDSTSSRTDWQIVEQCFKRYPERYHPLQRVPSAQPRVKDRIYSVNGMLKNQAGERRLLIDPKCKGLAEDFEQVVWKTDPHGNSLSEVDKSNKHRTHLSDALGYMIHFEHAMLPKSGERSVYIA